MANPSAAHEPSMEEILASIRQIISEDGGESEGNEAKAEQDQQPESSFEEVMAEEAAATEPAVEEETEAVAVEAFEEEAAPEPEAEPEPEPESASQGEPMTPQSYGSAAAAEPREPFAAAPREESAPSETFAGAQNPASDLMSAESGNAVHGAFSALAHTILAQNARTLEDLVAEMLQPMLKNWLDENLPALVERLVQEEIQRVSRGKR